MSLASVPTLADLDPSKVAGLPPETIRSLIGQAVLALVTLLPHLGAPEPRVEPVEVVGIEEAARLLGTSTDSLYRKRKRLRLGYLDPLDKKVKFTRAELDAYVRHQQR